MMSKSELHEFHQPFINSLLIIAAFTLFSMASARILVTNIGHSIHHTHTIQYNESSVSKD